MQAPIIAFLALCAFLLVGAVLLYNRLVRARNQEHEGWSGIDVQLRKRHDLVPMLVQSVRAARDHEAAVLEAVTASRSKAVSTPGRADSAEQDLSENLRKLFAVAESYPDLKASANFQQLSTELVAIEDALQCARRYYNGSVRDFRNLAESFPSNIIAAVFGFHPSPFFEVDASTEREAPTFAL